MNEETLKEEDYTGTQVSSLVYYVSRSISRSYTSVRVII